MSPLAYSFHFDRFHAEIPYLNTTITITSPWSEIFSIGSCFIYLLLILFVFPLFSNRWHKKIAFVHHGLLFVYSLLIFSSTFYYVVKTGEIFDWTKFMCSPVPNWLRFLSISFALSKIWEWGDTAILIWNGHSLNKIGFLHTYHHATTFLLFLLVTNFPGTEKAGMILNGFVHTLMYFHFAYRLPKIFRPVITGLQIMQLLTVTYMWYDVSYTCPKYVNFPDQHQLEYWAPYGMVPVYCLFFFKFFIEQYIFRPSNKSQKTSKKTE